MAPVHSVLALWPGASAVQAQGVQAHSVIRVWDSIAGLSLWRRRPAIWTWLKLAMAAAVAIVLLLVVGAGVKAYDYMMRDNDFCRGSACREMRILVATSISSRDLPGPLLLTWRSPGQGSAPPEVDPLIGDGPPGRGAAVPAFRSDTFPHARHSRLACLTCHDLRSKERLTFEPPRGCQACHHQRPSQANCRACHQPDELAAARPVQVAVTVPRHDRRRRTVQFPHAKHDTLACTSCHVTPVSLEPADSAKTCTGCHASHHAVSRDCAACHRTGAITAPHRMPVQAHTHCDACHTPATVARLVPTRSFCLACHQPQQDHYRPKECSTCHFQRTPAELQPKLTLTGGPP